MTQFFVLTPKGLEALLADELAALGARTTKLTVAGVHFEGNPECAYRAVLGSRLASRILQPLAGFPVASPRDLYSAVHDIDWREHLPMPDSMWVDVTLHHAKLNHSRYAAQTVKDAVVDQLRSRLGARPSIERDQPGLRLNLAIRGDQAVLSVDLGGGSLHQRGYRQEGGRAPLKEHLAAAILIRAGWPDIAKRGGSLVDPMCGSGTFLMEAALMAANIAPGLLALKAQPTRWLGFDPALWERVRTEAEAQREPALIPTIVGLDRDTRVLAMARANADRAGLASSIRFSTRALAQWTAADLANLKPGLLVVNPPYGKRLGEEPVLVSLYSQLGDLIRTRFQGWQASVFTGNPVLGKRLGIRAVKRYKLFNGPLACELLNFSVEPSRFYTPEGGASVAIEGGGSAKVSEAAAMFRNRLRKNIKKLGKWAARQNIECFRIYDADLPDYNAAIDIFGRHAVIQEYRAPSHIDPQKAARRLQDIMLIVPEALGIPSGQVVLKQRRRQRGNDQYERLDRRDQFLEVGEFGHRFLVNIHDYVDCGLFPDHRLTRKAIGECARDKRFLNLFAYTGSATVYAAAGGASATLSIDLSATYLNWARKNMALNGFTGRNHHFLQTDCLEWLGKARGEFDLIFLDPPTFSNSKSMKDSFSVERDHVELILAAARLLSRNGVMWFSTNLRGFRLDEERLVSKSLVARDITDATIPMDFSRNRRIHHCWEITGANGSR